MPTPIDPVVLPCLDESHWLKVGTFSTVPLRTLGIRATHPTGSFFADDPTYWAATTSGLFRLTPLSPQNKWELVSGSDGYVVNDVEVVAGTPNCVYAAVGFGSSGLFQHRGGVRFSSKNGALGSWTSLSAGQRVHNVPIADVLPDGHGLWVATYGAGLAHYDWAAAWPSADCGP